MRVPGGLVSRPVGGSLILWEFFVPPTPVPNPFCQTRIKICSDNVKIVLWMWRTHFCYHTVSRYFFCSTHGRNIFFNIEVTKLIVYVSVFSFG